MTSQVSKYNHIHINQQKNEKGLLGKNIFPGMSRIKHIHNTYGGSHFGCVILHLSIPNYKLQIV